MLSLHRQPQSTWLAVSRLTVAAVAVFGMACVYTFHSYTCEPALLPQAQPAMQTETVAVDVPQGQSVDSIAFKSPHVCRYELEGQGIKVVLIKPGPIKTAIWPSKELAQSQAIELLTTEEARTIYGKTFTAVSHKHTRIAACGLHGSLCLQMHTYPCVGQLQC